MLVKATPVHDGDGRVVMAVNIMEDVTEVRRAEHHQRFLAGASKLLSSSLDVDATLAQAARGDRARARGLVLRRRARRARARCSAGALAAPRAAARELDATAASRSTRAATTRPAGGHATAGRGCSPRVDEARLAPWPATTPRSSTLLRAAGMRSVADRAAGRRRPDDRRDDARDRPRRAPAARRGRPRARRGARPCAPGSRSRTRACTAARTHIAATLQRSLLPPRLPAVPGMTIAARFRAAGEATEVGGDFYDLFAVDGALDGRHRRRDRQGPGRGGDHRRSRATRCARPRCTRRRRRGCSSGSTPRSCVDAERRQICTAVCVRGSSRRRTGSRGRSRVACGGHPPPFRLHDGRAEPVAARRPAARRVRDAAAGPRRSCGSAPARASSSTPTASPTRAAPTGASATERLRGGAAPRRAASSRTRSPTASTPRSSAFEEGPQRDDVALLVLQASGRAGGGEASLVAVGSDRADAA